jgi:ABC-type metal ion transport system substrate-binding protein
MSSIEEINAQIAEYEQKIKELKDQRKIANFKLLIDKNDLKKMKNIELEASYSYRDSKDDEYAHWINASLDVKFTFKGKKETLTIHYSDEKGYHTESRYIPTIIKKKIQGSEQAMKILFKHLDNEEINCFIEDECELRDIEWFVIRDMIGSISE